MRKRLLSALLALLLLAGLLPGAASAAGGWDGSTKAEPAAIEGVYQIGTAEELAWFRDRVNAGNYTMNAVLTAEIDLNGRAWTPIGGGDGYATTYFGGVFDGAGFTVSNFSITATYNHAGFFGYLKESVAVHDLSISDAEITSNSTNVGGIAGTMIHGSMKNCSFSGVVTNYKTSSGYAGGIVGYAGNTSATSPNIQGCVNNGTIVGPYAGGIAAYAKYAAIANCYNAGTVTGATRAGGIVGQMMNGTSMTGCYNIGTINGAAGGLTGWNGTSISNCYWTQPDAGVGGGSGTVGNSAKIASSDGLLGLLNVGGNSAWVADEDNANGGYPILPWQSRNITPPDTTPSVKISGAKSISAKMSDNDYAALSVTMTNIDEVNVEAVIWSIAAKNGETAASIATLETVDNTDRSIVVRPAIGGVAIVTATVLAKDGTEYSSASCEITVIPHITTVEIENINQPGAVAVGQTVKAKVNVFGGGEYDYDNFPPLTYQWKQGTPAGNIAGATGKEYTIGDFSEWTKLYVEVSCGGVVVVEGTDAKKGDIRSADYGVLYPVAYDAGFTLPTDKKDTSKLHLPSSHTVNGTTATIQWNSSKEAVISTDGTVTLPESGKAKVTLTAKFTDGAAFANRTFDITVWSQEEIDKGISADEAALEKALAALGNWYKQTPVYGTDTNVVQMLTADLAARGYGDITVSLKSAEEVYGNCSIADNGDIDYFYADPNGTRGLWFGRYDVTFTLTKGTSDLDLKVPVTLYWDASKARAAMKSDILDKVNDAAILGDNDALDEITSALVLPKTMEGKKWALISWTSSDPGTIFISSENQGTADTLFAPYVGKVIRGTTDREVTLTAAFTFQRTSGAEAPIVMYQSYTVTVKALSGEAVNEARAMLLEKLESGFAAKGLRDAVTGETIALTAGVYEVSNDIQFPTTRDVGVDGKYFPITITSSDEDVIDAPDVANAARVAVYRPLVGAPAKTLTITVSMADLQKEISVSKDFIIQVQPLTGAEIDEAIALMDLAKAGYFDGLNRAGYADEYSVAGSLSPFQEAIWNEEQTEIKWIYTKGETRGNGIIADGLPNWVEQEAWRGFRSSDPKVLDHETLNLVKKPDADAFVRINSVLTHEFLGKYWEKFGNAPGYEAFAALYKQPVSAYVMVSGNTHQEFTTEGLTKLRALAVAKINTPISVSFALQGLDGSLMETRVSRLESGATVFEVFRQALLEWGYTYSSNGSYVRAITDPSGNTLAELEGGANSGWIYRVNGALPGVYMNGFSLEDGDEIVILFTKDYTKEAGYKPDNAGESSGTAPAETIPNTTTPLDGGSFLDVADTDWFYDDVCFVCKNELFQGVSATSFAPDSPMTRGMLVTVLHRLSESKYEVYEIEVSRLHHFADVPAGSFYTDAAHWAGGAGLVRGIGDENFGPELSISRQDLAVILYRYATSIGFELPEARSATTFADDAEISEYAVAAVSALYQAGMIHGKNNACFDPAGTATRGEVAAMLHRFMVTVDKG